MITLIENGEVHAPAPIGSPSILVDMGKIIRVGEVDPRGLDLLQVEYEIIDASGCIVTPGLIDPHSHLLGGSGESGFSTQTPMVFLTELLEGCITTVVGVLGVDTTMKTMAGLLARVKGLKEEGLSAWMWSGGYNIPPTTVLGSIREDMLFIDEIVGAGEIAISDHRSLGQAAQELARHVLDTHVGGLLSGKAGITHFHVGEAESRLKPVRDLLDNFDIEPEWLYPTHINRTMKLVDEAAALARRGSHVDIDTVDGGIGRWVRRYLDKGGPPERLTLSTDSGLTSPTNLFKELRALVHDHRMPLEQVLPMVTLNTATVLKLGGKGCIATGRDADLLVLDRKSLDPIEVIAGGARLMKNGTIATREKFLEGSNRRIDLTGSKASV